MSPLPQPDIQDEQLLDNLNSIDRRIGDVQAAARKRLTEAEADIAALEAIESHVAPTLLNSWVNAGGSDEVVGYYKDRGRVYLRGVVKNGTPSTTSVVFTLPSGYRPPVGLWFPATSNGAYATVNVQSDGDVVAVAGSNSSFSLSGISFSTT